MSQEALFRYVVDDKSFLMFSMISDNILCRSPVCEDLPEIYSFGIVILKRNRKGLFDHIVRHTPEFLYYLSMGA